MPELSMQPERPTDAEILCVLVDHFDVEPEEVLRWLFAFEAVTALTQYRMSIGTALENK